MFNDKVAYIFDELETLSLEKSLIENLRVISLTWDSSRAFDIKKYLRKIDERILQLSKSKDSGYALYIILMILNFLKEAKLYNESYFGNEEFFFELVILIDNVCKILQKPKAKNKQNFEKRKEILELIGTYFPLEFTHIQDYKILGKQLKLPF